MMQGGGRIIFLRGMAVAAGLVLAGPVLVGPALAQGSPPPRAKAAAKPAVHGKLLAAGKPVPPTSARAGGETLQGAMTRAYSTNPALLAERANLRATDENVPAALAGWRPQVSISASAGYADGYDIQHTTSAIGAPVNTRLTENRGEHSEQLNVVQPLYRGGQTVAGTHRAVNMVMAERARLIGQEQTTFAAVVTAYVNVIQAEEVLALNVNNEQVLARQLQATNDRFRVGEITRTDVAQAEAALAGAKATRQTAEGNLQTARASYQQVVGVLPGKLVEPQPLRLPTRTEAEAKELAGRNNPNVVAALFDDAAAKDFFDLQYSKLMPNLSLQGQLSDSKDVTQRNLTVRSAQIIASLSVPIYQGGIEYAAIRQARQAQQQTREKVLDARRTAVQLAISAWETYDAARATIASTREQVRSNQVALEGVQREAIVGSRTTLDVLNAEQSLLNSRVTLVQNLAALVTASYQVAAATGRLTARDLTLQVPLYDETAYYKAVRNKWFGTGDYAVGQPGR
ncbi:MAG: TolC family outer membrane protein [Rhodospirillales bacterium]|nr:TolC family outer membrane protein [Rhodospirillales bacterium]